MGDPGSQEKNNKIAWSKIGFATLKKAREKKLKIVKSINVNA